MIMEFLGQEIIVPDQSAIIVREVIKTYMDSLPIRLKITGRRITETILHQVHRKKVLPLLLVLIIILIIMQDLLTKFQEVLQELQTIPSLLTEVQLLR